MLEAIPATISQVKTMAGGLRIHVDTQENLTPEAIATVFGLKDSLGWFFFAKHDEKLPAAVDTAKLPPIRLEEGEKSPSLRLRNALFVFWDQNVRGRKADAYAADFDLFYKREIEKIIEQVKERLA